MFAPCFLWSQKAEELNSIAYEFINSGDLDSGLAYIEKAIDVDSTFFGSYYNRGVIYRELGDTARAINDFSTSIKYNSADADSYMNRGILYSKSLENIETLKPYVANSMFGLDAQYEEEGEE